MRTLLCVFNGEFGWEVGQWHGVCRKESRKFGKTFVIGYPDTIHLYADFAESVNPMDYINKGLPRTHAVLTWRKDAVYREDEQEFWDFGIDRNKIDEKRILIHARNDRITFKNYPVIQWEIIVDELVSQGFDVVSVGTKAFHVPKTRDMRNIPLKMLCKVIANAGLMMGPSSGPIHLAQHCKTPVLVWADNKIHMGRNTVRQRIEKTWNPFRVPSRVVDNYGWQPPPSMILKITKEFLKDLENMEQNKSTKIPLKEHDIPYDTVKAFRGSIKKDEDLTNKPLKSRKKDLHRENETAVFCNTKIFGGGERSALKILNMLLEKRTNVKGYTLTPGSACKGMGEFSDNDWRECKAPYQVWVMNDKIYRLQKEELSDFLKVTSFAVDMRIVINFVGAGFNKNELIKRIPIKKVVFLNSGKRDGWVKDCIVDIPTAVLPPPVDINQFLDYERTEKRKIIVGSHGGKHGKESEKLYGRLLEDSLLSDVDFSFLPGNKDLRNHFKNNKRMVFRDKTANVEDVINHLDNLAIYIYHLCGGHTQGPRTVIEAMAMGLPVITDACPDCGMRDRIIHGETGYLCDNIDEIFTYAKVLIMDKNLRKKIGDAARLAAKEMQPERWLDELL